MTPELTALTLAALLQVVHFLIYSISAQKQVGRKYAASPRDEPRELTGFAGRAQRAMNNHFEGLILFSIACLVVTYADKGGKLTALCALTYLCARLLYIPAYLFGWSPWRSLIWFIGFVATTLMLVLTLL
ncbi:MAPEG family protein [Primorskyibacter flagellatus]|uniref:Uncharacterized conserved protein, MAPEG superfamily n=1 Tax=Primorskyibacter flagellatus TaxID=1387277 RepID=A0A1W2AQS0_9RHOB|nr:MAPEG family protein [Primorskyibacter flagellatus]SMC62872.1 Uncharacterized conserved protein, MAPEG superfamily [Primorskyibacter flagellatus]